MMISSGGELTFITCYTPVLDGLPLTKQLITKWKTICAFLWEPYCFVALYSLSTLLCRQREHLSCRNIATLSPQKNYREQESMNNQTPNSAIIRLVCRRKQANRKSCISTSVSLLVISHNKVNCKLEGNILNHTGRLPNFHRALAANWCRLIKEHRNL